MGFKISLKNFIRNILNEIRKKKKGNLNTISSKENIFFYSDFGAEFNEITQSYLKTYNATLINVGNVLRRRKAGQIETFIRQLQRKIGLRLKKTNTLNEYVILFKNIIANYNRNWLNSDTGSTPRDFIDHNYINKKPWSYR